MSYFLIIIIIEVILVLVPLLPQASGPGEQDS